MKRTALAGAALAAGCTTLAPYAPPADGPRAEVRFVAATLGGSIDVVALDADRCDANGRLFARLRERQPPDVRAVYLADGAPAPAPDASAVVAAGRRFAALVQVDGLLDGWYPYACAASVSIAPQAGERYDLVYITTDPYRCHVDAWRVDPAGGRTRVADAHGATCALRAYRARP
jgi:hypothetical protein